MKTHANETPFVAPYESCTACFRGDTSTVVGFRGVAEWCIAGLQVQCGVPHKEAMESFLVWAEEAHGLEPGEVPAGRIDAIEE